jgi:hypothetical protein
MRLTVRTLLAWIDDMLGPDDRHELGTKVSASPVAPRLVERIREAVENPSLAAPAATGRGLADDPNTTAEFLDNVLDSDRLEAFERVCIESDMHLADVAGCHRILAEVLRDPDSLEAFEPSRGRAALAKARTCVRGPAVEPAGARGPRRSAAGAVAPPPARKRAPLAAWLSAAVALVLLVALGGVLVWTLTRGRSVRPRQVAADVDAEAVPAPRPPQAPQHNPPAALDAKPAAAPAEPPPAAGDREESAAPGMTITEAPPAEPPPPSVPPSPAPPSAAAPTPAVDDAPAVAAPPPSPPPAAPPAAATVPFGDAMAIGGATTPASAIAPKPPAADAGAGEPAVNAAIPEKAGPTLVEGAVLVRPGGADTAWRGVTAAGSLGDESDRFDLLAPAGIYPLIVVDGVMIRLHPGTRAVVSRVAGAAPTLDVVHGRVVVEGAGGVSWPGILAGGLRGALGVVPRHPVGIEVSCAVPTGTGPGDVGLRRADVFSGGSERPWRQAAADGAGRPLIGIPNEVLIPADTALRWDGRDPATAKLDPCPAPPWTRDVAPGDRTWRRAAGDLVAALSVAAPEAAIDALRRRAAAGLPEDRAAAAATLAFVGEPAGLVDLLCEEPPRGLGDRQWAAIEAMTVPVVLARGGPEAESLLAAFRERVPGGAAVAALVRGPGDDDLANDAGAGLVAGLDDASLVVRRYSILRLREIVPPDSRRGDDYRADRVAADRVESVTWWRALAARGGVRRGAGPAAAPPAGRGGE